MAGIIEVKDQGVLRIYDADNSNYVDIVVPSTVSSNRTITIPDATFTIPTSDTVFSSSTITGQSAETSVADDDLVVISDTSASGALKKMTKANFVGSTGKILQVVSTTKTDTTSSTSSSFADITGMSVAITPSATSSKILILYDIGVSSTDTGRSSRIRLLRDSTSIVGAANLFRLGSVNSVMYNASGNYLDSPSSTSALTYKLQWLSESGHETVYLNRRGNNSDVFTASTITVLEVGA